MDESLGARTAWRRDTEAGRTPDGVAEQREVHERVEACHLLGGRVMPFQLVLHIGGALKRQFADREPELGRMGLGREPVPAA